MTRTTTHCRTGCCRTGRPDACYYRWECDCHAPERADEERAQKIWEWQQEMLKGSTK